MILKRAASIPLITHDPFFSIWSSTDRLYDADPTHWTGTKQELRGYLTVGGKPLYFLGDRTVFDCLPQKEVEVTATMTQYTFSNGDITLKCRFTSPLLPDDLLLVSRPCSYLDFIIENSSNEEVVLHFNVTADLVRKSKDSAVIGMAGKKGNVSYASMGRAVQQPLSGSADGTTIDWGYVYVASAESSARLVFNDQCEQLMTEIPVPKGSSSHSLIVAYDDMLSLNYFGQWRKAYWTGSYPTILDAISAAFADKEITLRRSAELDREIERQATEAAGEEYAFLCNMSFRQTIAAHKLVTDEEGNILFLSKENDSNGCIGTVDISYPSAPLFLLYAPELLKGMLRPVFQFASYPVWDFSFAPHDVGRYPYAWGQVYGLSAKDDGKLYSSREPSVYPPLYQYPIGGFYDPSMQMPVEECGNMLILTAAVCLQEESGEFAKPYWKLLSQWKDYLIQYGGDPGEQLCTDDFAGHLAHNVNLAAKAIMGVEAYSQLARLLDMQAEAQRCHAIARDMAKSWEARSIAGNHFALSFGQKDSWSLKYNLVWDKIWKSQLFSDSVYKKELSYYLKQNRKYGVPLDCRAEYTKSDWIAWCSAMTEDLEIRKELLKPVAHYLAETDKRAPFSDWYDTQTGRFVHFIARSVQGGIYMPILMQSKMKGRCV